MKRSDENKHNLWLSAVTCWCDNCKTSSNMTSVCKVRMFIHTCDGSSYIWLLRVRPSQAFIIILLCLQQKQQECGEQNARLQETGYWIQWKFRPKIKTHSETTQERKIRLNLLSTCTFHLPTIRHWACVRKLEKKKKKKTQGDNISWFVSRTMRMSGQRLLQD